MRKSKYKEPHVHLQFDLAESIYQKLRNILPSKDGKILPGEMQKFFTKTVEDLCGASTIDESLAILDEALKPKGMK